MVTADTAAARFWNRAARKYAASRIADPAGYERTLDRTRSHLRGTDTVLEIGCGTGTTALRLAPHVARVVGTDLAADMIAIARERAAADRCDTATFEVAAADDSRWADGSFDAVLAFNLLHLVADREAVLRTIYRLLPPGGHFVSKTVCMGDMPAVIRAGLWGAVTAMRAIGKAPPVAFVTADRIEREVEAAGFTIVERGRHASKGRDIRPFLVARR